MTDVADINAGQGSRRGVKRFLLPLGLAVILGGAGFASTYLGYLSLPALGGAKPAASHGETTPKIEFVDIPRIVLTLAGPGARTLVMAIKLETDAAHRPEVEHLIPRLQDVFNSFLADIDGAAFEKRGILDIVRDELATRAALVLGKSAFTDILITEFRVQ